MSDDPALDGGPRFPEVASIRLPEGFLGRIKAAAKSEGITKHAFMRRAIAARLARITEPGGTPAPTKPDTTETTHG